jgi:hypothetical protein
MELRNGRTRVELLLMELLFQTVRTEHSSDDSEVKALKRSGFSNKELVAYGYDLQE